MCVITRPVLILGQHPFKEDIVVERYITKGPMSLKEVEQADNNHVAPKALSSTPVCSHPGPSDFVLRMVR